MMPFSSSHHHHHHHGHSSSSSSSSSSSMMMILSTTTSWIMMMMMMIASITILSSTSTTTNAFIFDTSPQTTTTTFPTTKTNKRPKIFPNLKDIAKQQVQQDLKFQIMVENPSDKQSVMALDGLTVTLLDLEEEKEEDDDSPSSSGYIMPGDISSDVSTGRYNLKIDCLPSFVGMDGHKTIDIIDNDDTGNGGSCKWELVWRDGDIAGNMILGMPIKQEAQRNMNGGAKLPKGHMYLSFLIWTQKFYNDHLDKVKMVASEANEHWQKSQDLLSDMELTSNIFEKASLYSEAREEHSIYVKLHHQFNYLWQMTPIQEDLIELSSGLLVLSTGTAWTDNGEEYHRSKKQQQQSNNNNGGGGLWSAAAAEASDNSSNSSGGEFYLLGKAKLIK